MICESLNWPNCGAKRQLRDPNDTMHGSNAYLNDLEDAGFIGNTRLDQRR
jgi:hypothetical protein